MKHSINISFYLNLSFKNSIITWLFISLKTYEDQFKADNIVKYNVRSSDFYLLRNKSNMCTNIKLSGHK